MQTHGEMPANPVDLSMWLSSFLPFHVAEKHALLVSTSTRQRLRACLACVASMESVVRRPPRENSDSHAARGGGVSDAEPLMSEQPPPPPPPLGGAGIGGGAMGGAAGPPAAAEAAVGVRAGGDGARG